MGPQKTTAKNQQMFINAQLQRCGKISHSKPLNNKDFEKDTQKFIKYTY